MRTTALSLSDEVFNHAVELINNSKNISSFIETIVPDYIRDGYGYYGCNEVFTENGKKYARIKIGDSCD